ncbi:MAG TPA: PQQ-binding-like beta-propeller repeat protein, partial [Armatimonadota bacterium]|nr:PQQ-binding-like beta-propeller repeat protein [Armatimonadota bacterium]
MDPTRTIERWGMGRGAARLLLVLALLLAAPALAGLSTTSDWPMMGGTAGHTGEAKGALPPAGTTMGIEWSRQLGAPVTATPAISDTTNELIVGTADGRVVWLDVITGAVHHSVRVGTNTPFLNTPLVDSGNDMVYAGNANGRLYAVRSGTPAPVWVAPAVGTAPWGPLAAAPIFIGDDILVASMDGCMYKVTAATGAWTRIYGPIGAGIEATPTLGAAKAVGAASALAADMATIGLTSVRVVDASLFDPGDELKIGPNPAAAL